MRSFCLAFLILTSLTISYSQNYYVAVVKGKVYYQNKLLQKRDKIKMQGNLKFSSADDYVKLSGPGGLYTIHPGSDRNRGNEFLVAVKEELFPKFRLHETTANSMVFDESSYFGESGISRTFLEKTHLYGTVPELKEGEELGFLHETNLGLVYQAAQIENALLVIQKTDFDIAKVKGQSPNLQKTAIVKVTQKDPWMDLIQNKDSIAHLDGLVARYSHFFMEEMSISIDPQTGEETTTIVTFPAEILDFMGPPRFIKRRHLVKDLRFHLKKSGAKDRETFLEEYEYEDYIWATYGALYGKDLDDVLKKDLKLHSTYDIVDPTE